MTLTSEKLTETLKPLGKRFTSISKIFNRLAKDMRINNNIEGFEFLRGDLMIERFDRGGCSRCNGPHIIDAFNPDGGRTVLVRTHGISYYASAFEITRNYRFVGKLESYYMETDVESIRSAIVG